METMLWTASLDDRYGAGQVTSRIGLIADAHKFDPDSDLWAAVNAENAHRPLACFLVYEAQFLSLRHLLLLPRLALVASLPLLFSLLLTSFSSLLSSFFPLFCSDFLSPFFSLFSLSPLSIFFFF